MQPKSIRPLALALAALVICAAAPPLSAKELSGVTMPDTQTVGGKTLKLNGMGVRKKAIFKVYVGGLYLENPSKDAAAILAADAPRVLRMHFVRSVEKEKLVEGFREGFEANAKSALTSQKAGIDKFLASVADVKDGSVHSYVYEPGAGITVLHGAQEVAKIEGGKELADAVFSIWLGPKPPSEDLKKGLLGQ